MLLSLTIAVAAFSSMVAVVALLALYRSAERHARVTAATVATALADAEARHEREVARIEGAYERAVKLVQYGTSVTADAKEIERDVEPEARARELIQADMIERGARQLVAEYEKLGVPMSLDDARAEARELLVNHTMLQERNVVEPLFATEGLPTPPMAVVDDEADVV